MKTNYYEAVKQILTAWPKSRDDDMLLYAIYLHMNGCVGTDEKFYDVMSKAKARKLPSYEGITRARRKVQELEPELRGKRYKDRKIEQDKYRSYYGDLMRGCE